MTHPAKAFSARQCTHSAPPKRITAGEMAKKMEKDLRFPAARFVPGVTYTRKLTGGRRGEGGGSAFIFLALCVSSSTMILVGFFVVFFFGKSLLQND